MRRPGSGAIVTRSFAAIAARPSAPVPPHAVATNTPTAQFRQHHHQVEAPQVDQRSFRQGWLAQTRLDGLLRSWRIDREDYDCACPGCTLI